MGELAVETCSVPMFSVGRADNHVTGMEDLDRLTPDLVIAHTSCG